MLKIAVCVTSTVDPEATLEFGPESPAAPGDSLKRVLNPADACALEQALRLRDRHPGSELTALSMGSDGAEPALRAALAAGAGAAVRLSDERFEASDSVATARVLAAAVRRIDADVIVCGERSPDGDTGQVAMQLAELLDVPAAAGVVDLDVSADGEARAQRRLDRALRCTVRCPLPALFAVQTGARALRYPRLRDRLRARREPIATWDLDDLGLDAADVGVAGSHMSLAALSRPKPTRKGMFVPDATLSPEEQFEQLISGGAPQPRAGPAGGVEGDPVERVVQFLVEARYV